ncbi:MAG: outer membrane lipoprotein-sorting protein [Oceanicaulis sp.]|nr:outer membrane lipoprotein-sorting protein [Maricaulis sp.]MBI75054.1 outer membrane lipoprotein-sorting protein [Oceanicaulis sp.]|tara:strand:- start:59 stop:916 length:858 start_codon:yes stop_codon:yes gene_type:complete
MKTVTTNLWRNALLATAAFAAIATPSAIAQDIGLPDWVDSDSERQGYEIAMRSDNSDNGFGDSRVEARMVLRNAAGQETSRELSFQTLERADNTVGDKSVVVFHTPADVEGTALLSHARILEPDDQWLYLPALARVRRISSANKSGPFVGSEFAFEDFTAVELNKYEHNYVSSGDVEIGGETMTVDIVERFPRYENSGYSRQVSYIDQDIYQIRRIEFFDRRGDLLKTLDLADYREYGDGIWRAHVLTMTNRQTGKSTELVYSDYEFGVGLSDNDFVRGVLERQY